MDMGSTMRCAGQTNKLKTRFMVFGLCLASLLSTFACGGGVVQRIDGQGNEPPPAPPHQGFLELPQGPQSTRIYLNDRYIGRYSDYPRNMILLPKGEHRLKFIAKGFAPLYMEVLIHPQRPIRSKTALISISKATVTPTFSPLTQ